MRTTERMRKFAAWIDAECCQGRLLKAPAPDRDITQSIRKKPEVYTIYAPARNDGMQYAEEALRVCPGIILMLDASYVKNMEEQRFDRYSGIHRPARLGQTLAFQCLFSVYEDGVRMQGYDSGMAEETGGEHLDASLILEPTHEGVTTLFNWMDDFKDKLVAQKGIPGTDLFLNEATVTYSLYQSQQYVQDRRPIYYGFVNGVFNCHADEKGFNPDIRAILE